MLGTMRMAADGKLRGHSSRAFVGSLTPSGVVQIHERENRVWNVVLLEIIHLLLHRHDPAAVFECVDASKKESKAKAFSSALSKCSLKPNLPSRHGRFGGKSPRSNTHTHTLARAHPSERNGISASKASGSSPAEGGREYSWTRK
jgi:hypothetical protein